MRAIVQTMPGIETPQTIGEVEIELRSLEVSPESAVSRTQFDSMQRRQLRKALYSPVRSASWRW